MLKNFISGTVEFNTFEKPIPAPYIRKSFMSDISSKGKIIIAVCGFYELYFNGKNITKGFLSPYISNTEDYIYCDEYDVDINEGENVIGILLGNGFQNNPGGYIWDFDKASFRSAPMVSLELEYTDKSGRKITVKTDETFKTAPSPILSDDYRFGEFYDANREIVGWCEKGFDDSAWKNAITVTPPCGELRICEAEPIVEEEQLLPVKIEKSKNGYVYDFGVSNAGVCRLAVAGECGQKIELRYADEYKNGELNIESVWFPWDKTWEETKDTVHKDTYICKGGGKEYYTPTFTYHGFRYVEVCGITAEQATSELLTFLVMHTRLNTRGGFSCSDETANKLQEMTRRSDVSNFHHFPTDCPQREKNGWTADAALSCEQMMLNFDPETNYREWLRNICKAQNKEGALPGIIPTGGWGFEWGNGPAWDCVLAYLPYFVYVYRGETDMIYESADNLMKYLKYLKTRLDDNGLLAIGLGDWCPVGGGDPKAPLLVTDSIIAKDIADKAALMFEAVGMSEKCDFALEFSNNIKAAVRQHLIDFETMLVSGKCQTSQAMALYYNIFDSGEQEKAFSNLLELIHQKDDHIDGGVLGGRVIFHVLSQFGCSDLAFKMITRKDYPSYGCWIEQGATTLWESFLPPEDGYCLSMNHHFWGDISAWFIKCIAGIRLNPTGTNITEVDIKPSFIHGMSNAEAYYISPNGKVFSEWSKKDDHIILKIEIPKNMKARLILENGYTLADKTSSREVTSGEYTIYSVNS